MAHPMECMSHLALTLRLDVAGKIFILSLIVNVLWDRHEMGPCESACNEFVWLLSSKLFASRPTASRSAFLVAINVQHLSTHRVTWNQRDPGVQRTFLFVLSLDGRRWMLQFGLLLGLG
ncbi:hypothetical protein MPTK2_3g90200P [Marchantia polymorpha subsp. ruderalis]